ncbi:MAG: PAS domain S-box [Caudoviricetes sp.]|nr:MAG: PAS domain S-box [Caudoviricetes sp.]
MFNIIKKYFNKNKKTNIDYKKIMDKEILVLQETEETLKIAEDIIKKLQNKIYDDHLYLEKILYMINDAILTVDKEGKILSSNNNANYIFGYDPSQLNGKKFNDIVKSNFNSSYIEYISNKCEKHVYYYKKCKGIKKDNQEFYIELSISKIINSNDDYYFIIILKDITLDINKINKLANKKGG